MKPLIIANWKMNPITLHEAKQNFGLVKKALKRIKNVRVVVCPPFVFLPVFEPGRRLELGGQDCFWEEKGSFTGEVSPKTLRSLGCRYVILGHSERRIYFGETDEMINKKIKAAFGAGLKVILCVGEKNEGEIQEIQDQLEKDLMGIKKGEINNLILAYEPIWPISGFGGKAASVNEAMEGALFVRKILNKIFGKNLAKKMEILYGGSASQNPRSYIYEAGMNGLVMGGSSARARDFIDLLKTVKGS